MVRAHKLPDEVARPGINRAQYLAENETRGELVFGTNAVCAKHRPEDVHVQMATEGPNLVKPLSRCTEQELLHKRGLTGMQSLLCKSCDRSVAARTDPAWDLLTSQMRPSLCCRSTVTPAHAFD